MRTFVRLGLALAATVALSSFAATFAEAKVLINIDLDKQTMHVQGKDKSFDVKVSSGKTGYDSPAGQFGVLWMDKEHHSDTYDDAYMPNAIFFAPGYAIHGFGKSPWGHKASHGCIRTPMAKSAELFDMVKAEGGAEITITGQSPVTLASIKAKLAERNAVAAADDRDTGPAPAPTSASRRAQNYADAQGYADTQGYADAQGYADPQYGYGQPQPQQPAPRSNSLFGGFY